MADEPNGGQPNTEDKPNSQQEDRSKWTPTQWRQAAEANETALTGLKSQFDTLSAKLTGLEGEKTQAAAKATKDEEERQRKQGEWEKLANDKDAKLGEIVPQLEAANTTITELTAILTAQLEAEIKDWPPEFKASDPGKDVPLKQRTAWKNLQKAAVEKFVNATGAARPGNRPGPAAIGGAPSLDDDRAKQAQRFIYR